jgi:uncharacterized DUF497 family protein
VIPNFEWDLDKARENERKHGVTFEEAATVFADFDAVIDDDPEHATDEDRFIIIGISVRARMLLAIYTIRHGDVVRIISARPAIRREKKIYEKKTRLV